MCVDVRVCVNMCSSEAATNKGGWDVGNRIILSTFFLSSAVDVASGEAPLMSVSAFFVMRLKSNGRA